MNSTNLNCASAKLKQKPVTLAIVLCCVALVHTASFSSGVFQEYVYNYEVNVVSGPNTFRLKAKASLDILYTAKANVPTTTTATYVATPTDSFVVRLKLTDPVFYTGPDNTILQPLDVDTRQNDKLYSPDHSLYAHIDTLSNGTALVREILTHGSDSTTFKNIKKSILLNILPTNHHLNPHLAQTQTLDESVSIKPLCVHDNNVEQPELFSPDSISHVNIVAKPAKSTNIESTTASNSIKQINAPTVFQTVEGYQNVTFRSRVFSLAESNLTNTFKLELVDQIKSTSHEKFDNAASLDAAVGMIDERPNYQVDTVQLEREQRVCSTRHCGRTMAQLFADYRDSMTDESMASVEAAVAFLRILDRFRNGGGEGTAKVQDILAILKKAKANQGVQSSILDILAAARTKESILAAFKHVQLTRSTNLDVAERFLSALSVAAKTAAKMNHKRPLHSPYYFEPTSALKLSKLAKLNTARMASLEFIANELLNLFKSTPSEKWASTQLRHSSLLTLATLVSANNQEHNYANLDDNLNLAVESLLIKELNSCERTDSDCRIVAMQAIGNIGRFGDVQYQALKDQVLKFGRRESNTAMKVLRDLLQIQAKDKQLGQNNFYTNLKDFLIRIVYDSSQETTSRVLAAEMIVRFVPNSLTSEEVLKHLPSFGNNELATMIYSRIQSLRPDLSLARQHENWYWKSCIINGTSASFVKTMARTDSLNASYGVNVEMLNGGTMLKESSFDVLLDTEKRTQDLFSLGLFARGLSSLSGSSGGSDDEGSDHDESPMAGMTLKILGGYLRPYVFFRSYSELVSHVMSGKASDPTTAFNGNLLLIDHQEGYPLISGFVAEQQMRGVLSIDVSGHVKVSWFWTKEAHSVVSTKAAVIVQASQAVYTSYSDMWLAHLFSFGGQGLIDFVSDVYAKPEPVRFCLQVTQPEFSLRYNSRRQEQIMAPAPTRKLTRRTFLIGAKSYSLNSENNKMCSQLADEL